MQGETKEKWMKLCERAIAEQDPQKLLTLVTEINNLLEAKERRLQMDATRRRSQPSINDEGSRSNVA